MFLEDGYVIIIKAASIEIMSKYTTVTDTSNFYKEILVSWVVLQTF